jgi:predicted DNA-binding transcriptional regulator
MNWSQDSIKMLGLTATEIRILDVLTEEKNIRDITSESGVSRTGVNHADRVIAIDEITN